MSGPIVRKYGFPNHEKIFGQKPSAHGAEESSGRESNRLGASELTPDLPDGDGPVDPTAPRAGGAMAPPTEFGQTGG